MRRNIGFKNLVNIFIRAALSMALLWYLYTKIEVQKTVEVVKTADLGYLAYAFLVFMVLNLILFLRWMVFIKALKLDAPLLSVARYYLIGLFGNLFLPSAIGGDVIKILGLGRYSSQNAKVTASVILDRLSGFAGMVVVAVAAYMWGRKMIQDDFLAVAIVTMAAVSLTVGTILFHKKLYSICSNAFGMFPRLKKGLMNIHYDIVLLKDRRDSIYKAVGLSCAAQGILSLIFYFLAKGLHQEVAFIYFLIFVPLICVASSVPSIGGLGVREAGAAYLLAKVGVPSGIAVSLSLMTFIFAVLVGLAGGLIFMTSRCPAKKSQKAATGSVRVA